MIENTQPPVLLDSKELDNGIHVNFYNLSKKLVGDRWLVKINCEAVCELNDDLFADVQEEDVDLVAGMREKFSGGLIHTITRERTFVDDTVMEETLGHLLDQLSENSLSYLASEIFPKKLFDQKFEEWKQEYAVKKEMGLLEDNKETDEDDGPADFSACFSD